MESKLEREVRFLKIYAILATLGCIVMIASAFTLQGRNQKFAEIDVERINIVEKDGQTQNESEWKYRLRGWLNLNSSTTRVRWSTACQILPVHQRGNLQVRLTM